MRLTLANAATSTGVQPAVSWDGDQPIVMPFKTTQAWITGTGAVSATIDVYSSIDGIIYSKRFTLSLSGTTSDSTCYELTSKCTFWKADVTAVSGTGAAVTVRMEV